MAVTWNPLDQGLGVTLSNGNLTVSCSTGYTNGNVRATKAVTSGKKYWEIKCVSGSYAVVGIANSSASLITWDAGNYSKLYYRNGQKFPAPSSYGQSFTTGDIIGVALDMDSGTIAFYKNGVSQGIAYSDVISTLGNSIYPYQTYGSGSSPYSMTANFGATAFDYTIPDGYEALDSGATTTTTEITGVVATSTIQAINPFVSAVETTNITSITATVATSTSQTISPMVSTMSNISIQSIRANCYSQFKIPSVNVIKNEISRLELFEFVRKPLVEIKDRNLINREIIRNIRTEVI